MRLHGQGVRLALRNARVCFRPASRMCTLRAVQLGRHAPISQEATLEEVEGVCMQLNGQNMRLAWVPRALARESAS